MKFEMHEAVVRCASDTQIECVLGRRRSPPNCELTAAEALEFWQSPL
jgi:hypothetical protein